MDQNKCPITQADFHIFVTVPSQNVDFHKIFDVIFMLDGFFIFACGWLNYVIYI